MSGTISVCIGNYGYYNEGELHDAWIELPKEPAEIKAFLEEHHLYDELHEEIYISDYDGTPFGCTAAFVEWTSLDELNLLASQMEHMSEGDEEKVEAWCDHVDDPSTILELMNIIEQVDDLPIYGYDFDFAWQKDRWGQLWVDRQSPEENLGWQFLQYNDELSRALDNDSNAMSAFDVERYGKMIESEGLTACQRFYIDHNANGPDLSWYDLDDFENKYGWGYGWGEDGDEDDQAA